MVSQANTVDPNSIEEPLRSVARSTSSFAEEAMTLAELQAQLAILESREWASQQVYPMVLALGGLMLALGLIPVAFLTLAAVLVEFASLTQAQAMLISLGAGIAVNLGVGYGASMAFKKGPRPFERTIREWGSNVRWFRNMVRRQGRRW